MKETINDYLVQKKRGDVTIWTFAPCHTDQDKGDYKTPFVQFMREVAHGNTMPNDKVFEIVADCIQQVLEHSTPDDARDSEPPVPIYTSEVNLEYVELCNVLESTFESWSDNLIGLSDRIDNGVPSPNEYNQAALYGYYNAIYMSVIDFLEGEGAWGTEEETDNATV